MYSHRQLCIEIGSDEWNALSEEEKDSLGLSLEQDGEFWMNFEDFVK